MHTAVNYEDKYVVIIGGTNSGLFGLEKFHPSVYRVDYDGQNFSEMP